MTQALLDLGEYVESALPNDVLATSVAAGELAISVRSATIVDVLTFLRRDPGCLFRMLVDITAVDYPAREDRFEVVYNLLSLSQNNRIRVKVALSGDATIASVTGVFGAAGWFEREVWDMFGIRFAGHPDLRRLLTDYGFEGHPLRKDFPLTGHTELRYDQEQKRVVYEPVKLVQEFRSFDFESPWEGMREILHGDEKAIAEPEGQDEPTSATANGNGGDA
jgi:NADH-quinone oxidoreductase subunit C